MRTIYKFLANCTCLGSIKRNVSRVGPAFVFFLCLLGCYGYYPLSRVSKASPLLGAGDVIAVDASWNLVCSEVNRRWNGIFKTDHSIWKHAAVMLGSAALQVPQEGLPLGQLCSRPFGTPFGKLADASVGPTR